MSNRAERTCILGCTRPGDHYASCPDYGKQPLFADCKGCAPRPARTGALICNGCYGRARRLLEDAGDLMGRIRSFSDPARARAYEPVKVPALRAAPPDQVAAEQLDALTEICGNLRMWADYLDPQAAGPAPGTTAMRTPAALSIMVAGCAAVILEHFDELANDQRHILLLAEAVLTTHAEGDCGDHAWSLADARARWGVERRDRFVYPTVDEEDFEASRLPVREWHDPLLALKDAAVRAGITERQMRRWVKDGVLEPIARITDGRGVVTRWFRASDVDKAVQIKRAAAAATRAARASVPA